MYIRKEQIQVQGNIPGTEIAETFRSRDLREGILLNSAIRGKIRSGKNAFFLSCSFRKLEKKAERCILKA